MTPSRSRKTAPGRMVASLRTAVREVVRLPNCFLLLQPTHHSPEEQVADHHMDVFDALHIVARDDQALIDQLLQLAALEASEAQGGGAALAGHLHRLQDVGRVATAA